MAQIIEITDLNDSRIDVFTKLTDKQLRNKIEPEKGIFIAENPKVIEVALNSGYEPLSLLTEEKLINEDVENIISMCGNIPVYRASRETLKKITGFELTRGALCAMKRQKLKEISEICKNAKRIAVFEAIADSTNIGALFRSAAALNIDAVLITPDCCDPLCRRSVRVSMGTVFQVPWAKTGNNPSEWYEKGIQKLKELGFKTAAMALSSDSVSIDDENLMNEEKLAIILGTEGDGLSENTIVKCDYTVKIPMSHGVDSLNVASAGAVAFWQLAREKRQ